MMKVLVPTSVDVKKLVEELDMSPTRKRNIKYKIYYVLSQIVSTNENYKLSKKSGGYRSLSSIFMKKVLGRKDYYLIIELLSNPNDPIIESDNSWHNPKSEGKDGYCKGYRLTEKYSTGVVIYKSLPQKFQKRVSNHTSVDNDSIEMNNKYHFLIDQFDLHSLSFDESVYDFIWEFGNQLLNRTTNNNRYQTKMIFNLIGRWLFQVEKIQSNDLWANVSPVNHRLISSFTNLPAVLRPFIRCNGKPLSFVDIKSSQPYLLASVMSVEFITSLGNGFNLKNIYPELYDELVQKELINENVSTTYNSKSLTTGSSNMSSTLYAGIKYNEGIGTITTTNPSPFMWGQFFNQDELDSIKRFQDYSFTTDFYNGLLQTYHSATGNINDFYPEERQKIKKTMMYVLFDDNLKHRNNGYYMKIFREVYPGCEKWIRVVQKYFDKHRFSHLLQRAESHLMLNVISREFNSLHPSVPIFTIHDAIYTEEEYIPEIKKLIQERFLEITGIRVGLKVKNEIKNSEPSQEKLEKEWSKIKGINSSKKYQEGRGGIFVSNIERGLEFINNWPGLIPKDVRDYED